jgi:hypothetical protein
MAEIRMIFGDDDRENEEFRSRRSYIAGYQLQRKPLHVQ